VQNVGLIIFCRERGEAPRKVLKEKTLMISMRVYRIIFECYKNKTDVKIFRTYMDFREKKANSPVPRVAAIHDLSGFGRSSLSIVIPTLSTMGVQVCPLPTAILSSQTAGMSDFTFFDLTSQMDEILVHWKKLALSFDAVYSGFLGSAEQASLVERCVREHITPQGIFLVDPVLGDDGALYPTQTQEIVVAMRKLACLADIITPNFTEACLLLGEEYTKDVSSEVLKEYLLRLSEMQHENPIRKTVNQAQEISTKTVIITSAPCEDDAFVRVIGYEAASQKFWQVKNPRLDVSYPGTGDTFASVFLGSLLQKDSVPMAMARASRFVYKAILVTYGYGSPHCEGIMLERILSSLKKQELCEYEVF